MIKSKVQEIVNEVFPKIEEHYGFSKFQECTPYIELHKNIYEKYSAEEGIVVMRMDVTLSIVL